MIYIPKTTWLDPSDWRSRMRILKVRCVQCTIANQRQEDTDQKILQQEPELHIVNEVTSKNRIEHRKIPSQKCMSHELNLLMILSIVCKTKSKKYRVQNNKNTCNTIQQKHKRSNLLGLLIYGKTTESRQNYGSETLY